MIRSKLDYRHYLAEDRKALGLKRGVSTWLLDDIWCFQRNLRRVEYYTNCRKSGVIRRIFWLRLLRQSRRLGFSIPIDVFGPGLSIAHRGTIVVHPGAKVGKWCRLHVCVNIGTSKGGEPTIGDNCYIAPGVKVFAPIHIADRVSIGANAVVTKSFLDPDITIAGVPARVMIHTGLQNG